MAFVSGVLTLLLAALASLISTNASPITNSEVVDQDLIGDIINLLGLGLVTQINTFISLESLTTDKVDVNFDVKNPLLLELTIDRAVSSAGVNDTVYAEFDHTFDEPIVVPVLGSANSGTFPNVTLTQGALNSLNIIELGYLDLYNVDVYVRAATINGKLGIPITITGLKQDHVNATYTISLN